jgi:hypothetical protein
MCSWCSERHSYQHTHTHTHTHTHSVANTGGEWNDTRSNWEWICLPPKVEIETLVSHSKSLLFNTVSQGHANWENLICFFSCIYTILLVSHLFPNLQYCILTGDVLNLNQEIYYTKRSTRLGYKALVYLISQILKLWIGLYNHTYSMIVG